MFSRTYNATPPLLPDDLSLLTKLKFGIWTNSSGMLWFNHVSVANTISNLCVLITISALGIFGHIDLALNNSTLGKAFLFLVLFCEWEDVGTIFTKLHELL